MQAALYARRGMAWFVARVRQGDRGLQRRAPSSTTNSTRPGSGAAWRSDATARWTRASWTSAFIFTATRRARPPTPSAACATSGKAISIAPRKIWRAPSRSIPKNAEAHDDLGVIYAQRRDYEKAAQHFQATIRSEPSYQKAYHNLAMVHYLTERNELALAVVDQALQLAPDARDSLLLRARFSKRWAGMPRRGH